MDSSTQGKPPVSFWIVAILGFLWNGIGAYFYLAARADPAAVMAGATPAMRDYVAHMPLWANLGYGFGIWGSFLGSILMLLRRRHAAAAFAVSFIGAAISFAGQALAGVLGPAEPTLILAVIAFLAWYTRSSISRGWLR